MNNKEKLKFSILTIFEVLPFTCVYCQSELNDENSTVDITFNKSECFQYNMGNDENFAITVKHNNCLVHKERGFAGTFPSLFEDLELSHVGLKKTKEEN